MRTLQEQFQELNPSIGFNVLAFPCNQFGAQEPGTDAEIYEFATTKYAANFPMFAKIKVNGTQACELYVWLKEQLPDDEGQQDIPWNFTKFLVSPEGEPLTRFGPQVTPEEIAEHIRSLLE